MTPDQRAELTVEEYEVRVDVMLQHRGRRRG
jgi:hypothetical protein